MGYGTWSAVIAADRISIRIESVTVLSARNEVALVRTSLSVTPRELIEDRERRPSSSLSQIRLAPEVFLDRCGV